ncbi:PAS domain-containing protein [Vibrio sp. SCSIO 43136]|uniref:PAS domain-containing protein n=1 Tax=Vibrio sp. SCSIO 43136 TaxID=2819101 RepID=UPI0020754E72|nr:PAS domain-containing protein [Vibrio sp. SCSIO 43136]USD67131.1 PAS domain S-box protein [Vibrio sp. SCSIO 43136]
MALSSPSLAQSLQQRVLMLTLCLVFLASGISGLAVWQIQHQHLQTRVEHLKVRGYNAIEQQFAPLYRAKNYLEQQLTIIPLTSSNWSQVERKLDVLLDSKTLPVDVAMLLDDKGEICYLRNNSPLSELNKLPTLFTPITGKPHMMVKDSGIIVVEDEVLIYLTDVVYHPLSPSRAIGTITLFREATDELIESVSRIIGHEFGLQFFQASSNLSRVSYSSGVVIDIAEQRRIDDSHIVEFAIRTNAGIRQPVSFTLTFPTERTWYTHPMTVALAVAIVNLILMFLFWRCLNQKVAVPMTHLLDSMRNYNGSDPFDNRYFCGQPTTDFEHIFATFRRVYHEFQEQHQFSLSLLDTIGDLIITLDSQGRVTYGNPAALNWLRLTEQQILGQPYELLIGSGESHFVQRVVNHTQRSGQRMVAKGKLFSINRTTQVDVELIGQAMEQREQGLSSIILIIRLQADEEFNHGIG